MAFAEVRAAWQRTANRCLVQEDAKRAPRLACCSSVPPPTKQTNTGPTCAPGAEDIPTTGPPPSSAGNPSYSNLFPNSRWSYCFQKSLLDERFDSIEGNIESHCINHNVPGLTAGDKDDGGLVNEAMYNESSSDDLCINFGDKYGHLRAFCAQDPLKLGAVEDFGEVRAESLVPSDVSRKLNDEYLDLEPYLMLGEKNTPWWRTADTEELASLVAQRSHNRIENCDLPSPKNSRVVKDLNGGISRLSCDEIYPSLAKPGFRRQDCFMIQAYASGNRTTESACSKFSMSVEARSLSSAERPLRDSSSHEGIQEMRQPFEENGSRAQLLEALRHSQTRAREAEKATRQACMEKEHFIKLVFRQASQLFVYRQWLQLLQLENMHFQFKTNKNHSLSTTVPLTMHWKPPRASKMHKNGQNYPRKKRGKRSRPWCDVSKYAVVFALGLGIVGAGLLLGWTVGWVLPAFCM